MDFHAYQLGHWHEWKLWRMWNYSHSSAVHMDNCSFKCVWSFIVLLQGFLFECNIQFGTMCSALLIHKMCITPAATCIPVGKRYWMNSPLPDFNTRYLLYLHIVVMWVCHQNRGSKQQTVIHFFLRSQICLWEGSLRAMSHRFNFICWY